MTRHLPLFAVSLLALVVLACCPLLPAQAAEENCTAQAKAVRDGRSLVLITFRCDGSDREGFGIDVKPPAGATKAEYLSYVRGFWRQMKIETPGSASEGSCKRGKQPQALALVGCSIELDGRARFTIGVRLSREAFCRLKLRVMQFTPIEDSQPGDPPPPPSQSANSLYYGLPQGC